MLKYKVVIFIKPLQIYFHLDYLLFNVFIETIFLFEMLCRGIEVVLVSDTFQVLDLEGGGCYRIHFRLDYLIFYDSVVVIFLFEMVCGGIEVVLTSDTFQV